MALSELEDLEREALALEDLELEVLALSELEELEREALALCRFEVEVVLCWVADPWFELEALALSNFFFLPPLDEGDGLSERDREALGELDRLEDAFESELEFLGVLEGGLADWVRVGCGVVTLWDELPEFRFREPKFSRSLMPESGRFASRVSRGVFTVPPGWPPEPPPVLAPPSWPPPPPL